MTSVISDTVTEIDDQDDNYAAPVVKITKRPIAMVGKLKMDDGKVSVKYSNIRRSRRLTVKKTKLGLLNN